MLSSTEISQMFASQQGAFAQQVAFSQQIGVNTPAMGGFMRPPPTFPGVTPPPPAFSYAPGIGGPGYSGGNRFAGGVMSGLGGAASLAGAGLGVASMFGKLGPLASAVDPIASGMAGFGMAGIGGAAVMGGATLGLGALAGAGIHSFVRGGQQQGMMNQMLSNQFQFTNPGSRSGQGFDRHSMEAISTMVRQMSQVPDMMTSFDELTKMIPKLRQMGTMQGVRDIGEFTKRFKEQVTTIRDMSKVLGTTMDEAADFFAHSKAVGFSGRQAMMQNALSVQFTAAQTGMATGQVMQMQQVGAQMATQMGVRRATGTKAITNMAQMLQRGVETGALDQGLLEDITGQQGAAATGAGAEMFTSLISQMGQGSSMGRMSMLAMAQFDKSGKFTGINKELARRFQRGDLTTAQMRSRVSQLTNQQKISATARMPQLAMEYAGETGPGGLGAFAKQLAGGNDEKALRILELNSGGAINATTGEAMLNMSGQSGMGGESEEIFGALKKREADIRQRTDPAILYQKFKTRVKAATTGKLEQASAEFHTKVGKMFDDFIDDLTGRAVVSMTDDSVKRLQGVFSGGGTNDLKSMLSRAGQQAGGGGSVFKSRSWGEFARMSTGEGLGRALGFRTSEADAFRQEAAKMGMDVGKMSGLMSDQDIGKQYAAKNEAWKKYGSQPGNDYLKGELGRMAFARSGEAGWGEMSPRDKAKALEGDINARMAFSVNAKTGEATFADKDFYDKAQAVRQKAIAEHTDPAAAMRKAFQSGAVNESGVANLDDAMVSASVSQRAEMMKKAENSLASAIGADGAAMIKAKPYLAKVLGDIQSGDSKVMGIVNDGSMSPEDKAKKLKELGYGDITASDIGSLATMTGKLNKAKQEGSKDPMAAINDYVKKSATSDVLGLQAGVKTMADSVGDSKLAGLLGAFAGERDFSKLGGRQKDVTNALKEIQAKLLGTKKGSKEEGEILSSLGGFASGAEEALSAGRGLQVGSTVSEESLAKRFNMSKEDLQKEGVGGVGGKVKVTDEIRTKLMAAEAGRSGTSTILGIAGKQSAGGGQQELVDTLKHIDKTLANLDTTIAPKPSEAGKVWNSVKGMFGDKSSNAQDSPPPGQ